MVNFSDIDARLSRSVSEISVVSGEKNGTQVHIINKFANIGVSVQKPCFYCRHGGIVPKRVKTSYFCQACGYSKPLCSPTSGRTCFQKHFDYDMSEKRRHIKE